MVVVILLIATFLGIVVACVTQFHGYLSTFTAVLTQGLATMSDVIGLTPPIIGAFIYFLISLGLIAVIIKIIPFIG